MLKLFLFRNWFLYECKIDFLFYMNVKMVFVEIKIGLLGIKMCFFDVEIV